MVAPRLGYEAFFDLAAALGVKAVEIRNDLASTSLTDLASARKIKGLAEARGLTILSVNALQRFNQWSAGRAEEAKELAAYAAAAGARALVLCPVNDTGFTPARAERLAGLREALTGLAPILKDHGVTGLVEPLGFAECSLRLKAEAVAAIDEVGAADQFKLVHDTFHHFVAGEKDFFPRRTGLVHLSGVTDRAQSAATMRDPHRVLVDAADTIDNAGQMRKLAAAGYAGPFSFEPFAASVHADPAIARSLSASLAYLETAAA
ncbi:MAG: TIM barrel protein [Rhizobiales bacterium]|nr:TIM barrel protein [Hyphomicrobiales bacterium]MBI3672981.1 TIM barrel protein [Hyphomicrobiales bacterium]